MKNILYIGFIILILASCTKLDEELYSEIPEDRFPENADQAAALTVPPYAPLTQLLDNGGWWFAQEVTSDEMTAPTRHTDWDDGGKWRVLHQHTWNNETEAINNMWSHFTMVRFCVTKHSFYCRHPPARKLYLQLPR